MERMEKTLEATRSNFNTVRTGRASPSLLDRVEVCVENDMTFHDNSIFCLGP
jgi:ribosome recycling factor